MKSMVHSLLPWFELVRDLNHRPSSIQSWLTASKTCADTAIVRLRFDPTRRIIHSWIKQKPAFRYQHVWSINAWVQYLGARKVHISAQAVRNTYMYHFFMSPPFLIGQLLIKVQKCHQRYKSWLYKVQTTRAQISIQGCNSCTFEGTNPVTSWCNPKGIHLNPSFLRASEHQYPVACLKWDQKPLCLLGDFWAGLLFSSRG